MSNITFVGGSFATIIENNFIDNYMANAPAVFSLIYIYGYRCAMAGISVSNKDIAKKFNVIESDVIAAWKYWKKMGLINTKGTKEEPMVEFESNRAENNAAKNEAATSKIEEKVDAPEKPEEKVKAISVKKDFTPKNISEIIEDNPEVKEILTLAETTKGKPFSSKETELVVWMYQDLELPFDVILVLLNFCYQNNRPYKYIEKTALDWAEKGILTSEYASDYLSFYSNYGKVLKFFGVNDRSASANERTNIDKWLKEWKMSLELVEVAAKRTVENTGKVAIPYCNKILESWHLANYSTIEDVKRAEANHTANTISRAEGGTTQKANVQQPKGVFNNYNQKIYSSDEIEEILKRKANG